MTTINPESLKLTRVPSTETGMLIRKPVGDVFEAIVNPEVTTHFWFTRSSGRLETGKRIQWHREMYNVSIEVIAKAIDLIADRYPAGIDEQDITKDWRGRTVEPAPPRPTD